MKFRAKSLYSSALVLSLLVSNVAPQTVFASDNKLNLTDAQFDALLDATQAEVTSGDQIDPAVDLTTDELVNIIVEFKAQPITVQKATGTTQAQALSTVDGEHTKFQKFFYGLVKTQTTADYPVSNNLKSSEITLTYNNVFNGVAITMPGTDVQKLFDSGVVNRIWSDEVVQLEDPDTEAQNAENSTMMDSIGIVNVDELHAEGIKGKKSNGEAIKVGVIDTGIDYNHPDLTGVYKGSRVDNLTMAQVKGWDFVENDSDPMETTYKDWLDAVAEQGIDKVPETANAAHYYTSHGTHVSGTIAGNRGSDSDFAVLGIAPEVEVYGYRALGYYGAGMASWIIGAVEESVIDGMDVVNMSLGASVNNPFYPTSSAVNNATLAGVTVVVAAGNAGADGEMSLGSPGTAPLAITVGASTFDIELPNATVEFKKTDNTTVPFTKAKMMATDFETDITTIVDKDVVYVGLGGEADYTGVDVSGKVALVKRGTYGITDKIATAKKAGAVGVVMFNNTTGEIGSYSGAVQSYCPTYQIPQTDGEALAAYLNAGNTLKVTFSNPSGEKDKGDDLAGFSSRGPVGLTYDIKPDFVAPGVSIFSTVPGIPTFNTDNTFANSYTYGEAYARQSGTSMATPHVAGIAALILSQHPEYTPADVKAALSNTAKALNDPQLSVFEQGAGRVDAKRAVNTNIFIESHDQRESRDYTADLTSYVPKMIDVDRGSINFGMQAVKGNATFDKDMSIKNTGSQSKTFNVTVDYHDGRTGVAGTEDILSATANGVKLTVPSTVTVQGNSEQPFKATLSAPETAKYGRYEGYVNFVNSADATESYRVPFAFTSGETGIQSFVINRLTVQSGGENWENTNRIMGTKFTLGNQMDRIVWYLEDADTGELFGYILAMDTDHLVTNAEYTISYLFTGQVQAFENNTSNTTIPVSRLVPTGKYRVGMYGVDMQGNEYVKKNVLYVDNTPAKMKVSHTDANGNTTVYKDGVYEVDPTDFRDGSVVLNGNTYNSNAYWVDVEIEDEGLNILKNDYGYDVNQGLNQLYYYLIPNGSNALKRYLGSFPVNNDGKTSFGIEKSDFIHNDGYKNIETGVVLSFANADYAYNVTYQHMAFVKEGTKYVELDVVEDTVGLGDTVTLNIDVNHLNYLDSFSMPLEYNGQIFEFQSAEFVDPNILAKVAAGTSVNTTPKLVTSVTAPGAAESKLSIEATKLQKVSIADGNIIQLKFKVISDEYYYSKASFRSEKVSYGYFTGSDRFATLAKELLDIYLPAYVNFGKASTKIRGIVFPEAISIFDPGAGTVTATSSIIDAGAKAYAIGPDGTRYDGEILNPVGLFNINGIPGDGERYMVYTKTPGHLVTYFEIYSGIDIGQGATGQYMNISKQDSAYAGDVNNDGVIDILDADLIMSKFKFKSTTPYYPEDLNRDGVVDTKDLSYVIKNFGKKDITATKEVQKTIGVQNLDYYARRAGLSTKK